MRASAAQSARFPPARLATRKVARARLDLARRPGLVAELDALRRAGAAALTAALGSDLELTARLTDAPLRPARALGHAALFCLVSLGGPGAETVLELAPRLAATLAELRTGGRGPEVPVLAATRFERALLGELLLGVLEALRAGAAAAESRWSPRLLGIGLPRAEAERRLGRGPSLALELALSSAMLRGRAVLHLPEVALRAVALGLPEHRPGPGPVLAAVRIAFSPRVCCGAAWGADVAGLTGAAAAMPGLRIVGGELHGPLSLAQSGVRLEGALGPEGFRHGRTELRSASQEVTHVDPALSELPVELEVELARVSLSLAELGALQPGAIVPLRVRAGDPVFLRAGDRRIGRAELVEVEGEVAARILELLP